MATDGFSATINFAIKIPPFCFGLQYVRRQNAALKSDGFGVLLVRGFVLVRHIGGDLKIALVFGVVCIGADIECLAQEDTPTKRQILIDDEILDDEARFNLEGKLVAQLSQNMNFIMDITVEDFLTMHAKVRLGKEIENEKVIIAKCFSMANELAGEKFTLDTKVTQLSGGQSRALMIADVACISSSPIVLIDEIENAGIDRQKAIKCLAKSEKIVIMSTHDPLLALNADKRIVIKNGGISKIIETTAKEKACIEKIRQLDETLLNIRSRLRLGDLIENIN